jgi:hypothetical protein
MHKLTVGVPTEQPTFQLELVFDHDYSNGDGPFDYIQMVRSRALFGDSEPSAVERSYWNSLEPRRRAFAAEVKSLVGDMDLIVDPPSRNTLHRPYLAAILDAYPDTPWVYLVKDEAVDSTFKNLTAIRGAVSSPRSGDRDFPKNKPNTQNVLIVDDAFSEGNVASVVIEKLVAYGIPKTARFVVAAPLRAHG